MRVRSVRPGVGVLSCRPSAHSSYDPRAFVYDREQWIQAGMDAFRTKPFDIDYLAKTLATVLNPTGLTAAGVEPRTGV